MKKAKLLRTLLIPTLGFWIIGTVTILTTSCSRQETSPYVVISAQTDSILALNNEGENSPNLQYSFDDNIWNQYAEAINIAANKGLFLKGNNPEGCSKTTDVYSYFSILGDVSLSGNIMGLLDNGTATIKVIPNNYCFSMLFKECKGLRKIDKDFYRKQH